MSGQCPDIVLVNPDIAQNTGSIARTCAGVNIRLHIVEPLGFCLDSRYLKRAGLDYWAFGVMCIHRCWDAFVEVQKVSESDMVFLSTKTEISFVETPFESVSGVRFLVFGSESRGLPPAVYSRYRDRLRLLPQDKSSIRSHNLAVSVGMAIGIWVQKRMVSMG